MRLKDNAPYVITDTFARAMSYLIEVCSQHRGFSGPVAVGGGLSLEGDFSSSPYAIDVDDGGGWTGSGVLPEGDFVSAVQGGSLSLEGDFSSSPYAIDVDDGGSWTGSAMISNYTGGLTKYKLDKTAPVTKDAVIEKLMPTLASRECMSDVCMSAKAESRVLAEVGAKSVADAKSALGCMTEECVLRKLEPKLGAQLVSAEIRNNFKHKGPTDNSLLSNVHIDNVMQWMGRRWPDFYPYNFNMANYIDYSYVNGRVIDSPDTLATIPVLKLLNGAHNGNKYRTAGCIINGDKYQGPGTHWMALFVDARGLDGTDVTLEFFNSSAGAPAACWTNWLVKNKAELEAAGRTVKIARVDEIRHQHSMTECGVYSLFYVYSRLMGVEPSYFRANPVPDQIMFEFRQHMFKGERGVVDGKFDWAKYTSEVKVKWE